MEREHANKEETEILPLAKKYLTDDDWSKIDAAFLSHSDPLFGDRPSERFDRLSLEIAARASVPLWGLDSLE